ncbi:HAMP domain-containing histidine kinase [Deinococcus sp. SDU3-2]|uniref:histidine kinase n=1 Tax=Deinococcus terrestris TaxID=2651870 RepID=A0A7X1NT20_9DEIO|nr:HAMP domain-containing sensor histidine kinase [Deinococcus terrestris]MPY65237.1 HAMP domain-containing histidine kinase [Deinococcus terrestris]
MTSVLPVVFVVSPESRQADDLAAALPGAEVVHVPGAEALLREAHVRPPAVALLHDRTPGVPLSEVLPLLRQRAELAGTHWLAVGQAGLGALLAAGADALVSDATPPAGLALQVRTLLARAAAHAEAQTRITRLQGRLDDWEHEERVRDQLVHMLVHDLKNPITAVLGLLEVVEDDDRVPEDARELVKIARDETQHLLHLSVNMLDVRKMQAGKMRLRPELVFSPMFGDVIAQARGDVGSGLRDRLVDVQVAPSLSPTRADPEILRRVLANLISNAMKHTATGGNIRIRVGQDGDQTHISVADDGEGIPEEDLPNLFAAFEQSRLTLHGRFDTGMGLAFCKLAVEEHGGRIWVESERGVGTTFTLTLPLAVDNEDEDDFVELLS